jgi:CMP-N,N'-diacetyllegionaminic acid synthase
MDILITICARGGSKGIPGKNIRPLHGKPLIAYSIATAQQFQQAMGQVTIALSSDDADIIATAAAHGLATDYLRPDDLAGDTVGKIDTIAHVLVHEEARLGRRFDYVLDLDVTSPLRNLADLQAAFAIIEGNAEAVNLFSVSPANRSPYFNMVERKENGFFAQVKQPEGALFTRQSAPKVYDLNASFYFYRRSFFDLGYRGAITDRSLIYEVPHTCFDLDHPLDFEILELLIAHDKLDFALS